MNAESEAARFALHARDKSGNETHRRWMLHVINNYDTAVVGMKETQFLDWQAAKKTASAIKDAALSQLPELLEQFEARITARGATVLWAKDAEEAQRHILDITERHQVRRVVKSKSMTTEEIELNDLLEGRGIEVLESDLGELIVQLADERPYHIVTPAMHKTRYEVSDLFQKTLGAPPTDDPKQLTQIAREHLRGAYVHADLGITGANFLIAEDGAIAITENEGNARLSSSCPKVHVAIAGIEKVLPKLAHLSLFWPLLATSGTGQQITSYSTIIRGPRLAKEVDGPEHLYVVLLDNGRSELYGHPKLSQSLRCIRCGACLNACPVFKTVGGHAYNTAYNGPIGSVITPQLRGQAGWNHLAFASSLCGACTEVCPVGIDLHHLLLENRLEARSNRKTGTFWAMVLQVWALTVGGRKRLTLLRSLARLFEPVLRRVFVRQSAGLPRLAPQSFAQIWQAAHGSESERQRPHVES